MDRALYIAANGASLAMRGQAVNNHNLANATTTGFRAALVATEAMPISGTRAYSREGMYDFDAKPGALQHTGDPLHVAINGDGWLTVLGADGNQAYTRAGDLRVNANGQLMTGAGHPVMGENGVLTVPPHEAIQIGEDGSVSIVPLGAVGGTLVQVDRLSVVDIPRLQVQRGDDGLMRAAPDAEITPVAGNSVSTGSIESANVNPASTLVRMIELSRQFEMNVRLMSTVDDNARAGGKLLSRG
jgi:flagellar basal-body rod protein FlgF